MSEHEHESGGVVPGKGRYAGFELLVPHYVSGPVEMPPAFDSVKDAMRRMQVLEDLPTSSDNLDVRPAIVFPGEVTLIGAGGIHLQAEEAGMEDWKRTAVVTALSGLATLAGLRIRE